MVCSTSLLRRWLGNPSLQRLPFWYEMRAKGLAQLLGHCLQAGMRAEEFLTPLPSTPWEQHSCLQDLAPASLEQGWLKPHHQIPSLRFSLSFQLHSAPTCLLGQHNSMSTKGPLAEVRDCSSLTDGDVEKTGLLLLPAQVSAGAMATLSQCGLLRADPFPTHLFLLDSFSLLSRGGHKCPWPPPSSGSTFHFTGLSLNHLRGPKKGGPQSHHGREQSSGLVDTVLCLFPQ